jgi:hypothetical protein
MRYLPYTDDFERPSFFYPSQWIHNAYVSVPEGLTVSGDDSWITLQKYPWKTHEKTQHYRSPEHRRHVELRMTKPLPTWRRCQRVRGEVMLGVCNYVSSFYHLLADLLYNVLTYNVKQILLPKKFPPTFASLLERAGAKPYYIENGDYCVENLLLPECAYPEWHDKKVETLRSFLLSLIPSSSTFTAQRLFISRRRALRRHLVNEQELIPLFEKFGVKLVHLEDFPIEEQLLLCSQAEWLLGPHGAGLTHILVSPPETKILEMKPIPTSGDFCFNHLAECGWRNFETIVAAKVSSFSIPAEALLPIFERWEGTRS